MTLHNPKIHQNISINQIGSNWKYIETLYVYTYFKVIVTQI